VTDKTRAILPVHYAGHPVELAPIQEIAEARGLTLVEDAAHALCASYRDRKIGSGSNPAAFSFYATKNLTTGEGGMLTGEPEFLARARVLSLHGMSRDAWKRYDENGTWYYEIEQPGFKYNMTEIQASLGLHQLDKLGAFQERRAAIVARYEEAFGAIDCLQTPASRPDVQHAYHLYVLRLDLDALTIARSAFIKQMHEKNIGTSVHFIPIHLHPYYRDKYGWKPEDFPVAYDGFRRMVSLPLNPSMSEQDVEDVVEAVQETVNDARR
jgi:dTDP-4-amino-4,6-dideoxygalactose transaminase